MRVLYGVVGEGMGHAMRSSVLLSHLTREHDVTIMASGRAKSFLERRFANVRKIHGYHMIYEKNRVRLGKTAASNLKEGATGLPENIAAYFKLIRDFSPEVVISDFESWTYLYAKTHRLPILSIDNMQIIPRATHDADILEGTRAAFQLTKTFIKAKLPYCDEYFVTTFFKPPVRKPDTRLFAPILRDEILQARSTLGSHLLVYQTGEGNAALTEVLKQTGVECRIYGMRRDLKSEEREGNLRYMPFSETEFIADLASSRAVVAGGGFTLMGEAVYLRKPMLAVPLERQFEQILNARYLAKLGFGAAADSLETPGVLQRFLERGSEYAANLAHYTQDGNREILSAVDGFLDKAAAGVA
jgi:uncharacterized protein (TIGR00661 family)